MREEWRPVRNYEGLYEVSNMGRIKSLERTVWNEKEIWKDIEGYEGYYMVSNMGRVKSLERMKWSGKVYYKAPERILKPRKDRGGYLQVHLSKDGKDKWCTVHKLVAIGFCENPEGYTEVNHINEDKSDNRAENLEWCSRSYNINYGDRNKRAGKKVAEKLRNYPKTSKPVIAIHKINGLILEFPSAHEAARKLGIANQSICACLKGRRKYAGNFAWYYADTTE